MRYHITSGLEKFTAKVESFNVRVSSIAGVLTLVMILTIVPDVLGRKILSKPIDGVAELNIILLVGLVYLGLSGAQARRSNFRVSFLVEKLPPRVQRLIDVLLSMLLLVLFSLFAIYTAEAAIDSTLSGEASYGVIEFPIWPARIAIALGMAMMVVQLLIDLIRALFGLSPSQQVSEGLSAE